MDTPPDLSSPTKNSQPQELKQPQKKNLSNSHHSQQKASKISTSEHVDRKYTPKLKFTNFSAQPSIVTKYVTSKYMRHDVSYFPREENKKKTQKKLAKEEGVEQLEELEELEEVEEMQEPEGYRTLVIHPGSRNLRIGRASNAFPQVIPHVIARRFWNVSSKPKNEDGVDHNESIKQEETINVYLGKKDSEDKNNHHNETNMDMDDDRSESHESGFEGEEGNNHIFVNDIKKELKDRMKAAKRRPVANAQSQVHSFNKSAHSEIIADHNDPYRVEWTDVDDGSTYYIGEKALRIPDTETDIKLFYPIQNGELNTKDYDSVKAVVGDLEKIWTSVLKDKFDILPKEFHEAVCVSFGAGISCSCVVDIGSQTTTVSCVEDGMCINDSRLSLHYGGDDITTFFIKLLKKNKFPYQEMNLNCVYDWLLAEEIKEKFCTLDEANLGIQLNEFFVRASNKHTLLYKSKIYDDAIIAPMLLFYPNLINFHKKLSEFSPKFVLNMIDDITEGSLNSNNMVVAQVSLTQKPKIPVSSSQASQFKSSFPSPSPQSRDSPGSTTPLQIENPVPSTPSNNNVTSAINTTEQESPSLMTSLTSIHDALLVDPSSTLPLDDAIIQSINATSTDERVKRFYPNIILVGGSSLIPGLSKMLEERLRARNIQNSDKFTILASPRELDPRLLAWKGGFVLSKLDIINEFWIGSKEWAELGVRSLRAKAFFIM
ncbi:11694_t:CDS:10 [Entrophospora sp. SA101]|nr:11694_t:CDS:10 [Entrophospora sp. SA101]